MSRIEYISPEGNPDYFTRWLILAQGLRLDGRRANELRTLKASVGILPAVDGSSLFELGNTRVLATVYGPREVYPHITLLYSILTNSCLIASPEEPNSARQGLHHSPLPCRYL